MVHLCVHIWAPMFVLVKAKDQCQVSSLITFHLMFWDRVLLLNLGLSDWLSAHQWTPRIALPPSPSTGTTYMCCHTQDAGNLKSASHTQLSVLPYILLTSLALPLHAFSNPGAQPHLPGVLLPLLHDICLFTHSLHLGSWGCLFFQRQLFSLAFGTQGLLCHLAPSLSTLNSTYCIMHTCPTVTDTVLAWPLNSLPFSMRICPAIPWSLSCEWTPVCASLSPSPSPPFPATANKTTLNKSAHVSSELVFYLQNLETSWQVSKVSRLISRHGSGCPDSACEESTPWQRLPD